jgi:hypothetical protein
MSMTAAALHTHYHVVLLHPTQSRVLLLPDQNGWRLPSFRTQGPADLGHVEESSHLSAIVAAMRRQLGLDAYVLYCADQHKDRERARQDLIYVLEMRHPSWSPSAGACWVEHDALAHLELALPEQRTVIAACLRESEMIPPVRPPWARRGWFALTESWIKEQLARLNYPIAGPIIQVRTWGISCIVRVPTTRGNVYFKVIPTRFMQKSTAVSSSDTSGKLPLLFTHEPRLIQSLAVWYPHNVPTVLAMDGERCWMLLAEFGTALSGHPDRTAWENALAVYGHMQVAATQHVDTLFAAGCLDRRLPIVETQVDPLFDDEETMAYLNQAEVEQLRVLGPQLKILCQQLAREAIPHTLVHGDLHTENIAVRDGNCIYYDWTDACVAHPFFDVLTVLDNVDDPVERMRLRDIYLAQWTDYASLECLREIFPLSQTLAAVHQAVSYQHIMANVEGPTRQDMRGGVTYWLRKLLQLSAQAV